MFWRCTLLLALCAFGCVRCMSYAYRIEYRNGGGPSNYPCSPECYAMIRQWFMQQGCNLPPGGGYGGPVTNSYYVTNGYYGGTGYYGATGGYQDPSRVLYIDYYDSYGQIESLKVSGPCFAYQLCDKCGSNGQCVVEGYSKPECKCKEGYEGDTCDEEVAGGQSMVIIAVTVIAGLLAFFILVAIIVHICWKHKGGNDGKKPNRVQVMNNPGHHHCKNAVNHAGPAACSHGHPAHNASFNVYPAPLRIHAATPTHGQQHCYPPLGGGHCHPPVGGAHYCPPRSTLKITEIVEDPPNHGGAMVPMGSGLFGNGVQQSAAPNVYTTIGHAPAGGTTITL